MTTKVNDYFEVSDEAAYTLRADGKELDLYAGWASALAYGAVANARAVGSVANAQAEDHTGGEKK